MKSARRERLAPIQLHHHWGHDPDMPLGALQASDVDYRAPICEMPALIVELAAEEAGPSVEIPADIKLEVEIALGRRIDSDILAKFAKPVPLSCPACGGVLSEVDRWPPLRFRCQVGHSYTADSLATQTEGSVDEALRVALRIMEERAVLVAKMAREARRTGREAAAASYEKRLNESQNYAEILRSAVAAAPE
jgi:two-component system chemotaxis response regulator CheB